MILVKMEGNYKLRDQVEYYTSLVSSSNQQTYLEIPRKYAKTDDMSFQSRWGSFAFPP